MRNPVRHAVNSLRVSFGHYEPRRVATPSSPAVALQVISALVALPGISILPVTARAVTVLMELLRRHLVTGQEIFDLQIVATMKAHNVHRIYTFNAQDFEVFSELTVIVPAQLDT